MGKKAESGDAYNREQGNRYFPPYLPPKCRGCFFFSCRTNTCDYILKTSKRRGMPVDECTRCLPRRLLKKRNSFGYSGGAINFKGVKCIPCITESGMIIDVLPLLYGEQARALVNNEWIVIYISPQEIEGAHPYIE